MKDLQLNTSRHFSAWLADMNMSIAFSSYQAGKLFLLGLRADGQLVATERTFNRAMGLWSDGQTLWAGTAFQIWRFENVYEPGQIEDDYDRLYVPRSGHTTGDIDVHDLAIAGDRLYFVSTLFSTIGTLSDVASFKPYWMPPFVSKFAAEDRCHLNGMAVVDDKPKFATAVARSDSADAWRQHRQNGGVVVDIETDGIVAEGLSMPHSPRWYRDRLWLLDSGNGCFGYLQDDAFQEVAFCPGYARGLAFAGDFALVGLSRPREASFTGLALEDKLAAKGAKARTGILVIDLNTGDVAHWLNLAGPVDELFDVAVLPGVKRGRLLGFKTDEIRYTVNIEGNPTIWRGRPK